MKNSVRFVHSIMAVLCLFVLVSCGVSRDDYGAELVSIEVTPKNVYLLGGDTQQFQAIGTYANNSTKDITSLVRWSVSLPHSFPFQDAVQISDSGLLTTNYLGPLWGSVFAEAGVYWDIFDGTAFRIVVPNSVEITPVDPSMAAGTSLQLTALGAFEEVPLRSGAPAGATDIFTRDVTEKLSWVSSDEA
ncbi:MAG: Ig-like domain-containing protein, partial [Proteobacteria bacterium]|nr:Ig-like domain-containing protein [Pseudomonadota bacterium]